MAIILCPECGKEVSDNAVSCPHCGYQLKETVHETNHGCLIFVLVLILLAILFGVWIMIAGP